MCLQVAGKPKGVMLTGRNLETMSALTLPQLAGDGGLLQEPVSYRGGVPVRLAPHRRHRLPRCGQPGQSAAPDALQAFVKERLGSVKTPKQIEIWPDLPRSRVGKVLKNEIKSQLLSGSAPEH